MLNVRLTIRLSKHLGALLLGLLLTIFSAGISYGAEKSGKEFTVKVALTYKLSKFVTWTKSHSADTFHICVLGEEAFARALADLNGRLINEEAVMVSHFTRSDGVTDNCRVLFIGDSKSAFLSDILAGLQGRGILTLGETDGFAELGGMIQFTRGDKRIGFTVNLDSARRSGLTIAAPLLQLSTVINTSGGGLSQ